MDFLKNVVILSIYELESAQSGIGNLKRPLRAQVPHQNPMWVGGSYFILSDKGGWPFIYNATELFTLNYAKPSKQTKIF